MTARTTAWAIRRALLRGLLAAGLLAGCGEPSRAGRTPHAPPTTMTAPMAAGPSAERVDALHARTEPLPPACPAPRADRAQLGAPPAGLPVPPIEREPELAPFFDALARLDRGVATDHLRIAVYGDSNLTMDYPTGRLRRVLSQAFGEGGHGFVAAGQPWSHYQHRDVRHGVVSGWKAYAITTAPTGDGFYGLGGIAVENEWQGATTFVQTAAPGAPIGTRAARFDVFYLRRPGGGRFDVLVDGEPRARVSTHLGKELADRAPRLGLERIEADEGEHRVDLVSSSAGVARLFGVALERTAPGIVVDTFGIGSLNTRAHAAASPGVSAEMLRARRYDLVVFLTGANDVFTMDAVPGAFASLVKLQRDALPGVPVLVVSPADRGARRSFPQTLEVIVQRRRLAEEHGLPYWSLFDAMGGRDAMAGFVRAGLARKDAIHWNEAGGDWAGDRLAHALTRGYLAHLAARPEAGCRHSSDEKRPVREPSSRASMAAAPIPG